MAEAHSPKRASRWPYWLERNRKALDGATKSSTASGGRWFAYHADMENGDPERLDVGKGEDADQLADDVADWLARLVDEWGLPLRVRVWVYQDAKDDYREAHQIRVTRGPKRRADDDGDDDAPQEGTPEYYVLHPQGRAQASVVLDGLGDLLGPIYQRFADANAAATEARVRALLQEKGL
jgi:hypothetical protein